ncbi:MAG: hypothetical protein COV35_03295 [Alphaproteobacteria bacterium CG11_big_fil_rev_8_21_14_0_20_39_49]|nr:MAG: hypothetical protein COV35_03295 [Alphaproteobacteria bacterium CG11_big_fil_rev_8_21_14_0_20_39_49]
MTKKYDYRKVNSKRTYKLKDVCRTFKNEKLHEKTIRTWIRNGSLEAFKSDGIIYINGGVLKTFLNKRYRKNKRRLTLQQFKCWYCKYVGKPLDNVILLLTNGRNNSLAAYGICTSCGSEIERLYKRSELPEILKAFSIKHNEVTGLCNSSCSTRCTHLDSVDKKPISEPEKYKPPDAKTKTGNSTKKAHINEKQFTLF